ncbi:MAG: hypothetical protein AB7P76_09460 [Candidatus Melainabacteria bacterium]
MGAFLTKPPTPTPPRVAFVLHDAGETKALQPVMQQLDQWGVSYGILADGTARTLVAGNPHLTPLPADIAVLAQTAPAQAAAAQQALNNTTQAPCVVIGLVSPFQKAWSDWFRNNGKTVVGYYDSFSLNPENSIISAFGPALNALVTPSGDTARLLQRQFPGIPVTALGQPTLEHMEQLSAAMPSLDLARQLSLAPGQPTLLFVGGYGPGYAQAFETFCQSVAGLPPFNLLIAPHPGTDGRTEQEILSRYHLQGQVRWLPAGLETAEALSVASMVLTHDSTMATQAALEGKPVLLVGETAAKAQNLPDTFNPLTRYGIAPRLTEAASLQTALLQAWPVMLQTPAAPKPALPLFNALGVPRQAAWAIGSYILSLLQPVNQLNAPPS